MDTTIYYPHIFKEETKRKMALDTLDSNMTRKQAERLCSQLEDLIKERPEILDIL